MPACHAGDRGFESRQLRHSSGSIAQLVEQRTENPRVGGSIPSPATSLRWPAGQLRLAGQRRLRAEAPVRRSEGGLDSRKHRIRFEEEEVPVGIARRCHDEVVVPLRVHP